MIEVVVARTGKPLLLPRWLTGQPSGGLRGEDFAGRFDLGSTVDTSSESTQRGRVRTVQYNPRKGQCYPVSSWCWILFCFSSKFWFWFWWCGRECELDVIFLHVTVTSWGWHGDASGESELSRLSSCACWRLCGRRTEFFGWQGGTVLECGIGLLQVCLSFVSLMCSRGAVVAMSRSMEAVVSLDDRFGWSVYVICLFDVF